MNPDELINLPDDRAWRLVDVKNIFRYKDGFYSTFAFFQKMSDTVIQKYRNNDDSEGYVKRYYSSQIKAVKTSIEFVRCFPIGSIWQKGQSPIFPSYFGIYDLNGASIKGLDAVNGMTKDFIEGSFISSSFNKPIESDCIFFDLKKPLYVKELANGTSNLTKREGGSEISFICFHSYEVYRYFLTSRVGGTLNHRILSSGPRKGKLGENLIYDPKKTETVNGENLVYLKEKQDLPNLYLIGNIAFDAKFKSATNHICSRVLAKSDRTFKDLEFPIETFKKMRIYAKRVKKKRPENVSKDYKDKWGLLVYQIESAEGFYNKRYKAIFQEELAELGSEGNARVKIKNAKKPNNEKDIDMDNPVNPEGDPTPIEDNGLFNIMNPELDVEIPPLKLEVVDKDGNIRLVEVEDDKDEEPTPVGPTGEPGDKKGSNVTIYVDRIDYYKLFNQIAERLSKRLESVYGEAKISWLNDTSYFDSSIHENLWNHTENLKKIKQIAKYSSVQIKVAGGYIYLFDKEFDCSPSEDRTWLMAFPEYREIAEIEIRPTCKKFLFDRDRTGKIINLTESNLPFTKRFNHMHAKPKNLITDEKELARTNEEAIDGHVERIFAFLVKNIK